MNTIRLPRASLAVVFAASATVFPACVAATDSPDGSEQYDVGEDAIAVAACGGPDAYPWTAATLPGGPAQLPAPKRTINVKSGAELASALAKAQPGDHIVLGKGTYGGKLQTSRSGTAAAPIVIRAATPLGATLTADFVIDSDYTVLQGVVAKDSALVVGGKFSRITQSRAQDRTGRTAITVAAGASYARVDHNEVVRYHVQGIALDTNPGDEPNHVWIDHNWIHERLEAPAGTDHNLDEAIQVGQSRDIGQAELHVVVERNLLEHIDIGSDLISLKSSKNIVCENTILDSKGGITARQGGDNLILSNYLDGSHLSIGGDGHRVVGNVVKNASLYALSGNVAADDFDGDPKSGCGKSAHPAAANTLFAGNSGSLSVGYFYSNQGACFSFPARGTTIEGHDGPVKQVSGHAQGVKQRAQTQVKFVPAKPLGEGEVGPGAP